jgi:UDP-N-acetylglucosamine--N-acetylmuramyl-(pentapeptide) pyrophosphoryl-undecaprenol N-acetylglucosamine transferase
MTDMEAFRIIISGGGTGGHIFPALAIAGELKSRYPDCEILFAGASGRMEMEKVPAAGYQIVGLPVMGFPRKPGPDMIVFFVRLMKSMVKARAIVRDFRPHVVVGVGGYASGPVLRAAVARNIPALIQEQNSFAGITNKLLAKKVKLVCVAYEGMEKFFPASKIRLTGNPVRKSLSGSRIDKEEALSCFGLKKGSGVLLITGGSLGARSVNNAVLDNLETIRESDIQVIWQTGSYYYREMVEKTEGKLPANLHIFQFLDRMDAAYAAADLVISRAGAGTISELCLVAKPAILVPSPNVAEDHQTRNAMVLVNKNAAVMVKDHEMKTRLFPEAIRLVHDPESLRSMSGNISRLALPDATSAIVDLIIEISRL